MKRMAIILIILAAAASLLAGDRMSAEHPRIGLVQALNLSSDQAAAWENAERSFHDSTRALAEQHQALHSQLERMLESKADACAIGAQSQQAWAVGQQLKEAFLAFQQKREAILTPDQLAKFKAMREEGGMRERRGLP